MFILHGLFRKVPPQILLMIASDRFFGGINSLSKCHEISVHGMWHAAL